MKRIKFAMCGVHPLLYLVRNSLIHDGYQLTDPDDEHDFIVHGGESNPDSHDVPVLFLSSSCVYSSIDEPISEDAPLIVPSTLDLRACEQSRYMHHESLMFQRAKQVMVLRPFNIYGPSITQGVVYNFLRRAKAEEPLVIFGTGYEVRAFLHEEDFLECVKKAVKRLLKSGTGIFNVASTEETTITRLADSVVQLTCGLGKPLPIERISPGYRVDLNKVANTTRVRAFIRWQPTLTVRKGIWRLTR